MPPEFQNERGLARNWIAASAGSAGLAVAMGAFGAHALKAQIPPERLEVFQTGAHYHLLHSVALMCVALLIRTELVQQRGVWVARLMLAGILLFSGSLYLLAATGVRFLGVITPLGGLCFIAAWILLVVIVLRTSPPSQ